MSRSPLPESLPERTVDDRREEHIARGKVHLVEERWADAAREFREAASIDPCSFWAPHLAGIALERAGAFDDSVPLFERGLKNADSNQTRRYALNSLQGVLARRGRFDDAWTYAEAMVALDPDDAEARGIRDGLARLKLAPAQAVPTPSFDPSRLRVTATRTGPPRDPRALPVPPAEFRDVAESDEAHLERGRVASHRMVDLLDAAGFRWRACGDVVDFGCGVGMRTRWLAPHSSDRSIWGVDVGEARLRWMLDALCPPLRVASISTTPHLPFRDDSIGLVDASSTFSTLGVAHTGWIAEFARVTTRGAFLHLHVFDERSADKLRRAEVPLPEGFDSTSARFASFPHPDESGRTVDFHAERHLRDLTRGAFELRLVEPAPTDLHTAYVFERT